MILIPQVTPYDRLHKKSRICILHGRRYYSLGSLKGSGRIRIYSFALRKNSVGQGTLPLDDSFPSGFSAKQTIETPKGKLIF